MNKGLAFFLKGKTKCDNRETLLCIPNQTKWAIKIAACDMRLINYDDCEHSRERKEMYCLTDDIERSRHLGMYSTVLTCQVYSITSSFCFTMCVMMCTQKNCSKTQKNCSKITKFISVIKITVKAKEALFIFSQLSINVRINFSSEI